MASRDDGHPRLDGPALGSDLVSHQGDDLRAWPDKDQPRIAAGPGKGGILRQESVARVDGLRARGLSRPEDTFHVQITLPRGGRTEAYRHVSHAHMTCVSISIAVDRDSCDVQPVERAQDAHGDLSPVGDEHAIKHGHIRKTP